MAYRTASAKAKRAARTGKADGSPRTLRPTLATARNRSSARMAYSVTCAVLRTVWTMTESFLGEMSGTSQRRMGSMMREECWPDALSPEAEKITASQIRTGTQYLRKVRVTESDRTL